MRRSFLLSYRGDIDRLSCLHLGSGLSCRLLGAALTEDVFLRVGRLRGGDLESLNDLARFLGGLAE